MKKPSVKKKEKEIPEDSNLGIFLKKSREERHVELDDIAEATRIRRYYLEAIENDEWEKLPSKVFIKGFLKSYAEFLGLDKEAVIHQYLRTSSVETNEPGAVKKIRSKSVKPYLIMIVSVLALIFIVAVIYLNERNISITNKAFQHLGTQSLEKEIEDIAKKEVTNQKDEREKEILLSEDEGAEDEVTKTTLKLKPVDDTKVFEDLTTPMKSEEEKKPLSPKLTLTANVKNQTWIAISIDEKSVKEYLFQPGQTPQWTAEKNFNILIGNAAGIELSLNGKKVGNLGTQGQVVRIRLPEG
jgi:cytoskeleton protein RodZ